MVHIARAIWFIIGITALVVGIIGAFLPLLPTVPLLLLAAFAFGKSSSRFEAWLINHPKLGPPIIDWRTRGAISKKAKAIAVVTLLIAFVIAYLWPVPLYALALQASVLIIVSIFILTRPSS